MNIIIICQFYGVFKYIWMSGCKLSSKRIFIKCYAWANMPICNRPTESIHVPIPYINIHPIVQCLARILKRVYKIMYYLIINLIIRTYPDVIKYADCNWSSVNSNRHVHGANSFGVNSNVDDNWIALSTFLLQYILK